LFISSASLKRIKHQSKVACLVCSGQISFCRPASSIKAMKFFKLQILQTVLHIISLQTDMRLSVCEVHVL